MNQLVTTNDTNFDVVIKDVENMQKMCAQLMRSKHYAKMGEDGVFAIIQASKSIGMNPLEGLNGGLYYVQGKVGMGAEMMNALIRKAGHSITKDLKSDNSICILHGKRCDNNDTWTVTFSIEDAKRAGLLKNMYDKYPGVMLYNRAMSMLARQLFPDVIKGAGYTHEELMEIKNSKTREEPKMEFEQTITVEEYISSAQIEEIESLLIQIDEETKKSFFEFIGRSLSINSIKEINVKQFHNIKNLLLKKIEKSKPKEVALEEEKSQDEQIA